MQWGGNIFWALGCDTYFATAHRQVPVHLFGGFTTFNQLLLFVLKHVLVNKKGWVLGFDFRVFCGIQAPTVPLQNSRISLIFLEILGYSRPFLGFGWFRETWVLICWPSYSISFKRKSKFHTSQLSMAKLTVYWYWSHVQPIQKLSPLVAILCHANSGENPWRKR